MLFNSVFLFKYAGKIKQENLLQNITEDYDSGH